MSAFVQKCGSGVAITCLSKSDSFETCSIYVITLYSLFL